MHILGLPCPFGWILFSQSPLAKLYRWVSSQRVVQKSTSSKEKLADLWPHLLVAGKLWNFCSRVFYCSSLKFKVQAMAALCGLSIKRKHASFQQSGHHHHHSGTPQLPVRTEFQKGHLYFQEILSLWRSHSFKPQNVIESHELLQAGPQTFDLWYWWSPLENCSLGFLKASNELGPGLGPL